MKKSEKWRDRKEWTIKRRVNNQKTEKSEQWKDRKEWTMKKLTEKSEQWKDWEKSEQWKDWRKTKDALDILCEHYGVSIF